MPKVSVTNKTKNKKKEKIRTETKEITSQQEKGTEKQNRQTPTKGMLHRVNISMLRKNGAA